MKAGEGNRMQDLTLYPAGDETKDMQRTLTMGGKVEENVHRICKQEARQSGNKQTGKRDK